MDLAFEKRLNTLLSQAFERPTAERRRFVAATCADDDELLAEALSVLDEESDDELRPRPRRRPASCARRDVGAR